MRRTPTLRGRATAAIALLAALWAWSVATARDGDGDAPRDHLALRLRPRLGDLDASMARTTGLLDQAKVFQDQLAAAQSRFVAEGCATGGCSQVRAVQLIADVQYAGHASRDLLQAARAELERAEAVAAAPTVTPLLDDERQKGLEALRRRNGSAMRGWLVRSAWYEERMAPWATKYKGAVAEACARQPGAWSDAPGGGR